MKRTIESEWEIIDEEKHSLTKHNPSIVVDESTGAYFDPFDYFNDDVYEVHRLEQLLLSSFVQSIYSFMEDRLNAACEVTFRKKDVLFKHTDLGGMGIRRSINYLEKVYGTKFPVDVNTREQLDVLNIVRNSISHNNSKVKESHFQKIDIFIKKNPDLFLISSYGELQLKVVYAESLLNLSEHLGKEIESFVVQTGLLPR